MIKRLAIIAPEFKSEYVLHQPWRQVYEIATRLQRKGISTAIITSDTTETKAGDVELINLPQQVIRKLTKESKAMISSFSPDIIYWIGNSYSGLYMKHNRLDIPVVLHISTLHMLRSELRNLSRQEMMNGHILQCFTAFYPFTKVVSALNNENIAGIIAANRTITDRLTQLHVNPSKIRTSPLFFEANFSFAGSRRRSEIATICYAGPADTTRGSMIALEAIKILKDQGVDARLRFLLRSRNPKVEKDYFENVARNLGILDRVEVTAGILSREDLATNLASTDIVVIPTKFVWNEPPLTVLEAMHLGRAVVTTKVCGTPEIVSGRALTVEPSAASFAHKIAELLEKRNELDKIGSNAKAYVDSLPGWDDLADWTLSTLEEFVENA